jgi:hypothetical protein
MSARLTICDYQVRPLRANDHAAVMALEREIFAARGEPMLGTHLVRLCCEFFRSTCFLALDAGTPIGYALSFVREREAHCATLTMLPAYAGGRAFRALLRALVAVLAPRVDVCWFAVRERDKAMRTLHATLGARELEVHEDYFGVGTPWIVSRIDREAFERLRANYDRLGLLAG